MDLGRLRTLRELSQRRTMAAVADALLISPSAVSQQISQLEDETGVQLVERRGRGIVLTVAGEHLANHAGNIIQAVEAARSGLAELSQVVSGELRIAAFPSVAAALLPNLIRTLRILHPQLHIQLDELEPAESLAALRAWQANLALIDDLNTPQGLLSSNIGSIALIPDEFQLLLPDSHRLARRKVIAMSDLKDENWAIDTAADAYSSMLVGTCRKAGFEPRITARCRGFELTLALVRGGCAIAICPALRSRQQLDGVRMRRLEPGLHRSISIAFRRSERARPALAAVLREMQAIASASR